MSAACRQAVLLSAATVPRGWYAVAAGVSVLVLVVLVAAVASGTAWALAERRRREDRRAAREALAEVARLAGYAADRFDDAARVLPLAGWHSEIFEHAQLGAGTLRGIERAATAAVAALED